MLNNLPQTSVFLIEFLSFCLLYLLVSTSLVKKILVSKKNYLLISIFVLFVQLVTITFLKKDIGDVMLFGSAGWYLRQKIDFYFIDSSHGSYPFLPFLIYIFAIANFLTETIKIFTFSFFLKLFELPALYFVALFIPKRQQRLQLLVNPIMYGAILFHGQIDVFLIALFFAASYFLISKKRNLLFAGIFLGASIASKTWAVFLVPVIMGFFGSWKKTFILAGIVFVFIMANIYIYIHTVAFSSFRVVIPAVISPGIRSAGDWGFSLIPAFSGPLSKMSLLLSLIGFSLLQILIYRKKATYWLKILWTILSLYIFLPAVAVQYFFWSIPFIYVNYDQLDKKLRNGFLILSTVFVGMSYGRLIGLWLFPPAIITALGFIIWCYCIFWLGRMLKR